MININEVFRKAKQEQQDMSVVQTFKENPEVVTKITVEFRGQEPLVIENIDNMLLFAQANQGLIQFSSAKISFCILVFKLIYENLKSYRL